MTTRKPDDVELIRLARCDLWHPDKYVRDVSRDWLLQVAEQHRLPELRNLAFEALASDPVTYVIHAKCFGLDPDHLEDLALMPAERLCRFLGMVEEAQARLAAEAETP